MQPNTSQNMTLYGTSGHGKGLVDMMSSFGVKVPIRRDVLTEDFSYWNLWLSHSAFPKWQWKWSWSGKGNLRLLWNSKWRSLYMISYFPDGFMMMIMWGGDTSLPHAFFCHITKSFPFFPNKAWKIKKIYNRCPPTFTLVLYLSFTRTIHTDCAWHLTILTLYQL